MKPCPVVSNCPCEGNPLTNFSSETPDQDVFLGFNSGWGTTNGPNPGDPWTNPGGYSFCENPTSQEEADLCAANCQIGNEIDNESPDCNDGGGPDPGGGPVNHDGGNRGSGTLFYNSAQSCSVTCPDGTHFTYTLAANVIRNTNPTLVDTIANSLACQRANSKQICLSSITGACLNEEYEQIIKVGDNVAAPVTFLLVSGSLPPGITIDFDPFGGRSIDLVGVPTVAGNYTFTIQATDAEGNVMEKTYSLAVLGVSNSPTTALQNIPYSFQFTAAGGTAPYLFTLIGSLPTGLTMSSSGLVSGTPSDLNPATFTIQVEDDTGEQCGTQFTMTPGPGGTDLGAYCTTSTPVISLQHRDPTLENWTASIVAGALPPGFSLHVLNIPPFADIFIQGNGAQASGIYSFTVRATDKNAVHDDTAYFIRMLYLDTPASFCTADGTPISHQITLAGAVGAATYAVTVGSLPTGVTLSAGGLLSGTPTTSGDYTFTVTGTDSASNACSRSITIHAGKCSLIVPSTISDVFSGAMDFDTPHHTINNTTGEVVRVYLWIEWSGTTAIGNGVEAQGLANTPFTVFDTIKNGGVTWSNEIFQGSFDINAGDSVDFWCAFIFQTNAGTSPISGTFHISCCSPT